MDHLLTHPDRVYVSMPTDTMHREASEIHETHVTHFQLTTTEQEVILSCGEMETEITDDGETEISQILYDTKLRMTHETAYQLKELLVKSFDS